MLENYFEYNFTPQYKTKTKEANKIHFQNQYICMYFGNEDSLMNFDDSMTYYKNQLSSIVRASLRKQKQPMLTEEQKERLKSAAQTALTLIALPGAIFLGELGRELLQGIESMFYRKNPLLKLSQKDKERKVVRTVYYLKEHGFIRMKRTGNDIRITLSKLGKQKLSKIDFDYLSIPNPGSWNGKWWQVAADIPTKKYRRGADMLRQKVKDMRFFPLQRTLWFYPHDPRSEIEFISKHYGISRFVTVMEVNRLDKDDERKMKKYFKLEKII